MNIYTNTNSAFPSQVVSDAEKASIEYGSQVAMAIEYEWFKSERTQGNRYLTNWNQFHQLRLYARGEQSIQKYKDELSINGDLSYLNLDWKPVPVIPKFVDIVVNGMSQRSYDIKAFAQDPESIMKRTAYAEALQRDMMQKDLINQIQQMTGLDVSKSQGKGLEMESEEDLQLHMQMDYKESIEVAEEEVINNVLASNKYDLTRRRLNQDLNSDDFVDIADKLIDHSTNDSDSGLSLDNLPELIEKLESKMKISAKDLDFEKAAIFRDRIKKLRHRLVGR